MCRSPQISGIALVALGAVIKGYYNKYLDFLGDGVVGAPILLIIVGIVIFFVAFMGCCGAIRESYCMTMTFAVLLALIFILELAAGIAAYVLRDDIRDTLNTNMQATMQNYAKDKYDGVTKTWDGVQMEVGLPRAPVRWHRGGAEMAGCEGIHCVYS